MRIILVFIIVVLLFPNFSFGNTSSCSKGFETASAPLLDNAEKTSETIDGREIQYKKISVGQKRGYFDLKDIIGRENLRDYLVIGFFEGHSYAFFGGQRIDSKGTPFVRIQTYLKQSTFVYGQLLFLVKLTEPEKKILDSSLASFKSQSSMTCVAATCNFTQSLDIEGLNLKTIRPDTFFKQLLSLSEVRDTTIIALNGNRLTDVQKIAKSKVTDTGLRQLLAVGILASPLVVAIAQILH